MIDMILVIISIFLWGRLALLVLFGGKRIEFWLRLPLMFGAGCFAVAWLLFIYFLAGGRITHELAVLVCVFPAAALFCERLFAAFRRKPRPAPFRGLALRRGLFARIVQIVFLAVIVGLVVAVFHDSQQLPLMGDARQIWGYKAKILYYESLYSPDFHDESQVHQHPNYPLLVPILETYSYAFMGRVDDLRVKLLFPAFYVCLLMCVYSELRRRLGPIAAIALLAVFATFLPLIYNWGGLSEGSASSGYADLPLVFFYTLAVIILLRWLSGEALAGEERRSRFLTLITAAILLSAAVFTKNEGLAIAVIVSFVALFVVLIGGATVQRRQVVRLLLLPLLVFVLSAPWLAWRAGLPAIDANCPRQLTLDRIQYGLEHNAGTVLTYAVDGMTPLELVGKRGMGGVSGWTLFWPVLVVACVLFMGRVFQRNTLFISLVLAAHVSVYFLVLLVTPPPWTVEDLMKYVTLRLAMHFSGVAVLLFALLLGRPGACQAARVAPAQ